MMLLTSAKSRLMRPGRAMRSEMPLTPWRRTSSAMLKACVIGVFLSTTCMRRSFGIVMIVSTCFLRFSMPSSALRRRFMPSNENGRVTTPTVNAPISRAHSATTGAAPVPVPPPMPAVTKTMSAPRNVSRMSSRLSSAAFWPISGCAPAPRPRVSFSPICMRFGARDLSSACASVLTAMNSTPCSPRLIMRLTALLPPPPTPITLILAN